MLTIYEQNEMKPIFSFVVRKQNLEELSTI